jgi:hypothetical protein
MPGEDGSTTLPAIHFFDAFSSREPVSTSLEKRFSLGDASEAVRRFIKVALLSGGIAAGGAILKLGVRQAVTFELWSAIGGGLIVLGAILIIAALASRKDMPSS